MDQPISAITVETLVAYSAKDAAAIGRLMPHLSDKLSDNPVAEQVLNDIVNSPYHEQFVARDDNGEVVGTATVSITMGAGVARGAWLEDFVVEPAMQGAGIGNKLWVAILSWCQAQNAHKLDFTSSPSKEAAQRFYLKRGAIIRDTNYFRKEID